MSAGLGLEKIADSAVTDRRYRTFETSCNFKRFENLADDFRKRTCQGL